MTATYSKPTKVPRWADTSTNIVEPLEGKKDEGWLFEEVPPSSWENWRTNLAGSWFKWVDERFFDGASKDQLLIKSPGSAVDALRITDTYVKSHLDFRVEGDDLGVEVDGANSRRIYFDASKQNWLGYNLSTSRMELYAAGTLALWADATQCFINGDIVLGDDLSVPGGLAVGIASPTYADDVIQLGDANLRWEYNAGNPQFVFDHFGGSIDALKFDRTSSYFSWLIANTEEARLSASGLAIANGLYVGDATVAPTDNVIIAEGSGGFGGSLRVGFAGSSVLSGVLEIGDQMFYLRQQSGNPSITFDSNDGFNFNRSIDQLTLNIAVGPRVFFTTSGVDVLQGLYVGGSSTPVDDTITCEGNGVFWGGLRVGFSGVPTADRIELGDPNMFLQWSSDVCELDFASGASFSFSRTNSRYAWLISTTEELRLTANGLAVGNGLYVGDVTGTPVDNSVIAEGDGVFANGLRVGFTGAATADRVELGDANLFWQWHATLPYIQWDSTDYEQYDRTNNLLKFFLGSTEEMRVSPGGLVVPNGLLVGFTGTPSADRIMIGDTGFYAELATHPYIYFDALDYLRYERSINCLEFYINNTYVFRFYGNVARFEVPIELSASVLRWANPGANPTTFGEVQTQLYTGKLVSGDGTNTARYLGTIHQAYEINRTTTGIFSTATIPANTLAAGSRIHAKLRVHGLVGTTSWSAAIKINGTQVGQCGGVAGAVGEVDVEAIVASNPGGSVNVYTSYLGLDSGGASHSISYQLIGVATNANVTVTAELTFASGTPSVTLRTYTVEVN